MLWMNMLNILIAILLSIVFAVRVEPSSITYLDSSNTSNESLTNRVKGYRPGGGSGSCFCNCPTVCSASAATSSGCFASDTLVTLATRKRIPIGQLKHGDQLLTTDGSNIFTTQMILMLDKQTHSQTIFHTITTASGHHLSLTPLHLIPIILHHNTITYVPAKEVKIDDVLYVMSDDGVMMSSVVIKVMVEMKSGYYAPLTTSGTLLVNGLMASCYANVQSHEAAHFYMGVLRWYYRLSQYLWMSEPFGDEKNEGMHVIPSMMYEFGRYFRPTTLRFT